MSGAGKRPNALIRGLAVLGNLGGLLFPLGAIALLSVPAIWTYQVVQWFQAGRWPSITFADGLRWASIAEPRFNTPSFQQASENLMSSPLSLVLLFGIGSLLFVYARFSKWLERRCEPEKASHE